MNRLPEMISCYDDPRVLRGLSLIGAAWMLAILLGWAFGIEPLLRTAPHRSSTVPSTALCLALLFVATTLPRAGRPGGAAMWLVCAAVLVAGANLLLGLLGLAELDQLLLGGPLPGQDRMSGGTAMGIVYAGGTLAVATLANGRFVAGLMAVLGMSSFVAIIAGNSFVPNSEFSLPALDGMSIYTAVSLALLFLLMLLAIDSGGRDDSAV